MYGDAPKTLAQDMGEYSEYEMARSHLSEEAARADRIERSGDFLVLSYLGRRNFLIFRVSDFERFDIPVPEEKPWR